MPRSTIRLVAIGGGTGLATLLRGLKSYVHSEGTWSISDLAAIVTVTDEGGSSGVLRREFSMLPPGDVRNCIVALAEEEQILSQLFNYRFGTDSTLTGHSLGNLLLTALTDLRGSFLEAVRELSEVLAIRGTIYPAALEDLRIRAHCADGTILEGETAIGGDRLANEIPDEHSPIVRLELEPSNPPALPEAIQAIRNADVVVIGPGSLYTSIIPNLVIPELGEAVRSARGLKIYICNVMTQPGETDGYDATAHLQALLDHAGLVAEAMIVNGLRPSSHLLGAYQRHRQFPVDCDPDAIRALGVTPFFGDIIAEGNYLRHDPGALADTVFRLYERYGRRLQKLRRER